LYELGGIAENKRISEIDWVSPRTDGRKRISAPLNRAVRDRVATRLSSPRKVQQQLDGILDMADFKPSEYKCRIDPAIGASVICTFDEREANRVQSLLRKPIRVMGEAIISPDTERIESFHIQSLERLPSLSLGEGNFFAEFSLLELAASQKVKPMKEASILPSIFSEGEDIDKFLEEIYSARK